ncbi:hypothetical protein PV08_11173 [Exophiala spinifera]|uniref:NmrA-like domain-containing protein n=1 Tax=Exophiala spinifera TaxID=91928 RepID=A0A0D1ZB19_9EURO|nr:uncharacterized protein PV08_11173 [Exophiala spinifera]KIW10212.1 hypothetical protein PV08_11173 [Exophiala spinifera]
MSLPHIALVGATGTLGRSIFKALVSASFPLTILTRAGGRSKIPLPPDSDATVQVKEVDYASHRSLVEALSGADVVVSALGSQDLFAAQKSLIDASVEAGVQRFLPSEYGNGANGKVRRFPLLWADKDKTQRYLERRASAHPEFTYSIINTGSFFDWQLELGLIVNLKEHTATVYDGGDVPNSVTTLDTIAKAVVAVITHPEETRNRHVFVHDAAVTQNQLMRIATKIDGEAGWDTTPMATADVEERSHKAVEEGDYTTAMLGFIARACWGPGFGQDFGGKLDNDLLGLPVMKEEDVEALMRGVMAKIRTPSRDS